jgi:acyl-coenzyme A thioesterase PaaI-like protein
LPSFTRNAFDICHGGALTTFVDITTTCSLYAFDEKGRTHVSAKLDMDFLGAGKTAPLDADEGQVLSQNDVPSILIDARINRIGR